MCGGARLGSAAKSRAEPAGPDTAAIERAVLAERGGRSVVALLVRAHHLAVRGRLRVRGRAGTRLPDAPLARGSRDVADGPPLGGVVRAVVHHGVAGPVSRRGRPRGRGAARRRRGGRRGRGRRGLGAGGGRVGGSDGGLRGEGRRGGGLEGRGGGRLGGRSDGCLDGGRQHLGGRGRRLRRRGGGSLGRGRRGLKRGRGWGRGAGLHLNGVDV
jgi:hypothetical protein